MGKTETTTLQSIPFFPSHSLVTTPGVICSQSLHQIRSRDNMLLLAFQNLAFRNPDPPLLLSCWLSLVFLLSTQLFCIIVVAVVVDTNVTITNNVRVIVNTCTSICCDFFSSDGLSSVSL